MILLDEAEYQVAMQLVEGFFRREPMLGTPESDFFNTLADAICAYEDEHYPFDDVASSLMTSEGCPNG
jgi:antitoxin component HigA of HigAB toxin-antitoxin module